MTDKRIEEIRRRGEALRPFILKASENGLSPDEAFLVLACDDLLARVKALESALDEILEGCDGDLCCHEKYHGIAREALREKGEREGV